MKLSEQVQEWADDFVNSGAGDKYAEWATEAEQVESALADAERERDEARGERDGLRRGMEWMQRQDRIVIGRWTNGAATISYQEGTEFATNSGSVSGESVEAALRKAALRDAAGSEEGEKDGNE